MPPPSFACSFAMNAGMFHADFSPVGLLVVVRHGIIHPAFRADAASRKIRNGVGVADATAIFAISERPVNLYEFATFFRDTLHCPDALYLDGVVSGLYSMELGRKNSNYDFGPIIGVVQ